MRKRFFKTWSIVSRALSGGKVFGGEGVSAFDPETNGMYLIMQTSHQESRVAFIGVGNRGQRYLR